VIIKRKPKGVTAKAFIDEIMRNVQIQDGNWNKKVKSEIFFFFLV